MTFDTIINAIAVYAIPVLFAIALHEAAHGYAARHFGDSTAADAGRLTLNPFHHIDPFGTVLLPLMLSLIPGVVPFGYAKPVPVDFSRLNNPRKDMALVALAGPMANFAMGLGWMIISVVAVAAGSTSALLADMVQAGIWSNAAMFVFNLFPVPPLDGGRIMTSLLPPRLAHKFASLERYSMFIIFGIIALMQFGLLQGFLGASMKFVVLHLFVPLVYPLNILLN
ncbi:MAG: site-2 protease family protein [Pseudomonadota bacterium]